MSRRNPWTVFSATSTGVVAVFLNTSGVNVALPTIARELGASAAQSSWVLLSYMLVTTALILAIGRLADIVGRRPLYLGGYVLFTLATAACALAPGPELLIAARTVQAVGAAALVTNTTALLTDTFPPGSLGRGLGLNATVAAVTQALGPLAGGAATSWWGWRGTFLVTLPICVAGLVWSLLVIPRGPAATGPRERFDGTGAVLSTAALAATLLALSPDVLTAMGFPRAGPVLGGAALLLWAVFVAWLRRSRSPLVDLGVLLHRLRAPLYAAVLLNAAAQYAVVVLASLVLQSTGRVGALAAGLLVSPLAVGTTAGAVVAAQLVGRFPARTLVTVGSSAVLAGTVLLAVVLTPDGTYWPVFAGLLAVGFGTGLFMTPGTSLLMLTVPADRRGVANGVRSALQNVGFLLSTAVGLGLATRELTGADRADAYAGALRAAPQVLGAFSGGVRTAMVVLSLLALGALLACLALPARRPAPLTPPADAPANPPTTPPVVEENVP
ncbi:MFS transporter [Kineococcus rhizosphaerae]|uniref:EmrB/QacA subfamily drug resistance transporter n=1 Tax=Kineococcus rhizosphaerae TaxID=559628 RepID=A0A2T0R729_9ACTN|nr:MFS transporter [Kineococcus rhizosphaerae]PRY16975.1 EmrB/QacA subfamily drug resistance transporter [Kineococcus rhizosphaerae]